MLESEVVKRYPIGDQEILCRALIEETERWINDYKREHEGG
jgi:glycine betaine catabolism A